MVYLTCSKEYYFQSFRDCSYEKEFSYAPFRKNSTMILLIVIDYDCLNIKLNLTVRLLMNCIANATKYSLFSVTMKEQNS